MAETATKCVECGASILPRTAEKTGGRCMPCAQGTRAQIDEARSRAVSEREWERIHQEALERIRSMAHPTFGDFLAEDDPNGALWPFLAEQLDALTPSARTIYFVSVLDREVFNGGFHQYFSNSSGKYAQETLAALRELGAVEIAELLAEAIDAFPEKQVPKDRKLRNEQLDRTDARFLDSLDSRYYALDDDELTELVLAFMKRHAAEHVAS